MCVCVQDVKGQVSHTGEPARCVENIQGSAQLFVYVLLQFEVWLHQTLDSPCFWLVGSGGCARLPARPPACMPAREQTRRVRSLDPPADLDPSGPAEPALLRVRWLQSEPWTSLYYCCKAKL